MNIALKNQIKAHILEEPNRLNMDDWFTSLSCVRPKQHPSCGTVACLAGWSHLLTGGDWGDVVNVYSFAQELQIHVDLAYKVCFVDNWPMKF